MSRAAHPRPVAETTLLSLRPSRLVAVHYYVTWVALWVLAALAFFNVFHVIPDWLIPFLGITLKSIAAGLLAFFGLVALAIAELRRLSILYVVTDARVIRRDGLVRRRMEQMPLNKIERVELDQGMIQRMLKLGDIVLDTGEDQMVFESIRHVRLVQDELSAQVAAQARRS